MDKNKLRKKVDEQTAHDSTTMRHWSERRRKRYERYTKEPVLPLFCRICFICMPVATACGIISDVAAYLRSHAYGLEKMLQNAAATAFFVWAVFSAMLIPAALVQLRRGFAGAYFDRYQVSRKGKMPLSPEKVFRRYWLIAVIGLLLFMMIFLFTRML